MLKLAVPMIVTNISFTVMQFVDRFMVSRLGTDALAAVLPAGFVSFIPAAFAIGVCTCVNTLVSQSLGRKNKSDCASYCWQAIYMGLVFFAFVLASLWPLAPWIFGSLMKHAPEVVVLEVTYLRIMLYAQVLAVFIWTSSQFFMGVHQPVITMYAALVAQTINMFANYVLIFGKFGFPAMGIAGAGWGTFIGISVGAGIRMYVFLFGQIKDTYKTTTNIKPDFAKMKQILRIGTPAGLGLMINVALWGVFLFILVAPFGKEALAATSAAFACINVSVMPVVGLGTALTAAVGKAIGQGRHNLAAKQASNCLRIAVIYMGLVGICFFLFRNQLMLFWSTDEKVISIGAKILICAAIFQVFDAASIVYTGALRGAGDTLWLALISMAGTLIILVGGGVLLTAIMPQIEAVGPWVAATVNIIAVGLANRWRFKTNSWKRIDLFKRRGPAVPVEIE